MHDTDHSATVDDIVATIAEMEHQAAILDRIRADVEELNITADEPIHELWQNAVASFGVYQGAALQLQRWAEELGGVHHIVEAATDADQQDTVADQAGEAVRADVINALTQVLELSGQAPEIEVTMAFKIA